MLMRERRFWVAQRFGSESQIELTGSEAHHLLHVLRLGEGDEIVVFDGKGGEYLAVITACGKKSATAIVRETLTSCESPLEITMAVAIPKGDKMSGIVRMLTELGVHRIVPITSSRTMTKNATGASERVERWERIALEACKQSGRSYIPTIDCPLGFDDLLGIDLPRDRFLVCPEGDDPFDVNVDTSCLALIGPEGGWSPSEIEKAVSRGFRLLGLGPRTLRVETAAATAAALFQWRYGDMTRLKNSELRTQNSE
jgi:16S rRNA (uracil1498-N3)-methyltransferase